MDGLGVTEASSQQLGGKMKSAGCIVVERTQRKVDGVLRTKHAYN